MPLIERVIAVSYRHRVYFTRGVFDAANCLLGDRLVAPSPAPPAKALVTLDEGLATAMPALPDRIVAWFAAHADRLRLVCPPIRVEGGERAKHSAVHVAEIQAGIERHELCRHSYVIAIGGGAHLDVVGLAAATAHRGVRHVRIPTTTLAQADSGVGVKNGINAFGKKNFIGVFAPPFAVINDFDLLASLPPREKRGGFAEAVKVALIRDADFFDWIEAHAEALSRFEAAPLEELIRRCAELHVNHIATSGDPFEFGSARPLDFGHWAAHKLEPLSGYELRHGEAVAIGIALDTVYARRAGMIEPAIADRVLALLERLGFRLFAEELHRRGPDGRLLVLAGLEEFREHLGGELTVTLLAGIGRGVEVHEMNVPVVADAIAELAWRARPACGGAG